ncbi:hypothetical protein EF910_00965 [Streptomyces sp. WAC07149]|uniref:hypothetical protein n=1 Tax=Streptomyces sp. WAC07149 TaxID=2487425 RepID=UPI000F795223|nr:hypothetical protein [Streptomyces sp. WAC07149]RST08836.1 hypothetical protein EF910_00965 [Streptomyces sp. WAC07149]
MHERYVHDDEDAYVAQLPLGGHTVRAGHSAVLTELERAFATPAVTAALASLGDGTVPPDC